MIAIHVLHALVESSDLGPGVSYFGIFPTYCEEVFPGLSRPGCVLEPKLLVSIQGGGLAPARL